MLCKEVQIQTKERDRACPSNMGDGANIIQAPQQAQYSMTIPLSSTQQLMVSIFI